jgi:hypothetical protein
LRQSCKRRPQQLFLRAFAEETTMHARKPRILFSAVILVIAGLFPGHHTGDASTVEAQRPFHAAGYIVHIDPLTGELTPSPASTIETKGNERLQNAILTSSQGLSEEPSAVAGGGIMVDLHGRFQNVFIVTLDDSSGLRATCSSGDHHLKSDGGGLQ